jgi:parallel beta-helix repeat protein
MLPSAVTACVRPHPRRDAMTARISVMTHPRLRHDRLTAGLRVRVAVLVASVAMSFAIPIAGAVSACPSGGIAVSVSDSTSEILAKIAAPGHDRVFCWEPGIHRINAPMSLHPGDSFLGLTDPATGKSATLIGSRPVTGWARFGPRTWVASLPRLTRPVLNVPPGVRCLDGTNHCAYPDDVYRDDHRLKRVWSLKELVRGAYFIDYASRRLYMGARLRPTKASRAVPLPVVSGRSTSFIIVKPGGVLRDLTVREVGVGLQGAAIACDSCMIDHVDVSLAHGRGVDVDDLSVVTSSAVHDNGQAGIGIGKRRIGSTGSSGVVAANSVYRNGWIRCLGICGGIKASTAVGLSIVDNVVSKNLGTGIWMDNDSIDFRISGNTVVSNRTAGIEAEISYDGVIEGNTVTGSGLRPLKDRISVGAIHVLASGACSQSCPPGTGSGIVISGNTVGTVSRPNAFGIVLRQMDRGSGRYGPHLVRNVTVTGNGVVLIQGWTGAVDPREDTGIYDAGNAFTANTYTVPHVRAAVFRWMSSTGQADAWLTFAQWQAEGNDVDGTLIPLD